MSSTSGLPSPTDTPLTDALNCGSGGGADTFFGLRVAAVFIILAGSTFGALFPVLAKRSSWLHVPKGLFDFAKYFGSGIIIATSFIHLLSPGLSELSSPCLSAAWTGYPYALAICLVSIFSIFIVELIAFRWGTAKLAKLGIHHDPHAHIGSRAIHGPEGGVTDEKSESSKQAGIEDLEALRNQKDLDDSAIAQIIGVAVLEFGVLLHSILIGLTLAVDANFKVLFVVIVFHQMFEGLGIGSRLAYMMLPQKYNFVPIAAALLYGITTPVGVGVGLGVRSTYNPGSTTASIVSGVLDSTSAGILIYTGMVELLAHEFLFNKEMANSSNGKLAYALGCMCSGVALMALLGNWA